ncbi:MFS transporter, DHA2 family, multidrug resistance protein [Saccharopolyspora antimicrobica]|uniref:DHA2 family multidrug resistance protein-like MFS transporter n=1 Tax=Saccharopolyspora antimicrobica TaxID=455193 RepID=A0A1I5L737_9PSEU|nr:MFS transporter [Saccharopolyspora antimicrobica]RKT86872.1 DHA2 family multidrug resistance protein-like MFS transporter [Saccharopolyspora antimicrobica]SFO92993.1 MFS transporter, DHA2 family, multidrug resistance protein [Saccharopolyspora antimicrobica]
MHTPVAHRAGPREWTGLAILALPTALLGLDVSVLYLALPALSADLQPTATQALWIMDAYGFLIAGLLITMGTLGDRIGRRKLLMIGAACFGAVSVVAAFATSAELLIAARAALGIAGATLMPSTLSLLSTMFTDARQRAVAIGIWATTFALGMAAGPLVGGVLLDHFWWGSAFLVAVPPVGVLLLTAPLVLPEYRAPGSGRLDLRSVVLSLAAILPLIYAVKHTAKAGLDLGAVLSLLLGAAFAVVFVRRQRELADPLLDMSLFTSRTFNAALGVLLFGLVGVGGVMFLVTQYLQLVEGLSPFAAGLWMGPPALMMFLAALASPLFARRVRPGVIVAVTLALSAAGYVLLSLVDPGDTGLVVGGFGLVYLGLGAIAALGTDLVVGASPPEKSGSAAAMSETVQELGLAVGVAVLGSLTSVIYRSQLPDLPPGLAGLEDGLAGAAAELPGDLLRQAQEAFTAGLNVTTLVTGIGVLALAAVSATVLRHIGTIGDDGYDEC